MIYNDQMNADLLLAVDIDGDVVVATRGVQGGSRLNVNEISQWVGEMLDEGFSFDRIIDNMSGQVLFARPDVEALR